jgi:hypothetical protein
VIVLAQSRCKGAEEVVQKWCIGADEVLQRFSRGAEVQQTGWWCRAGAEMQGCAEVQTRRYRGIGAEMVVQWCRCRSIGAQEHRRSTRAQEHRSTGAEEQRCTGAQVQRCRDAKMQRCRGATEVVQSCTGGAFIEVQRSCRDGGAVRSRCRGLSEVIAQVQIAAVIRCKGSEVQRCRGACAGVAVEVQRDPSAKCRSPARRPDYEKVGLCADQIGPATQNPHKMYIHPQPPIHPHILTMTITLPL